MESNNQNGTHVQNGTAKNNTKAAQIGTVVKENVIHPKKDNINNKVEVEKLRPNLLKDEKPEGLQPGQPKAEEQNPEVVQVKEETLLAKPVLNLENRLKVVDDLHRRSIQ